MSWSVVPQDRPSVRPPSIGPAWALAVVPLVLYLRNLEVPGGWAGWLRTWAVPVGLLGLGLLLAVRRSTWTVVPASAAVVGLGVILLPSTGPQIGVVLVLGCLVWAEGTGVTGVVASRLDGGHRFWPVLLPAVLAAVLLVAGRSLWLPAVLLAVALGFAGLAFLFPTAADRLLVIGRPLEDRAVPAIRRVGGWVDRLAAVVAGAVRVVVMVPAVVTVTVLWLVHRLVGYDPLRSPSGVGTRWVERAGTDRHPERQLAAVRVVDHRSLRERLSGAAVPVVVGVLALAGVLVARSDRQVEVAAPPIGSAELSSGQDPPDVPCEPVQPDPVLAQQEDHELLLCEQSRAFASGEYRPPTGYRMSDFAGSTLNVADGVRRTWSPPPCGCERIRLWWFGGSAAWGEGQRDDHTIPSLLAQRAWQDGIALDIENRAMPTWTFGQEVHAFADQLSAGGRPDLAVFYTGGNDLVFQGLRMLRGRPEDSSDIVLQERYYSDLLRNGIPVRPAETEWSPDPATFEQVLTSEAARSLAPAVTARLERNLALAGILGSGADVPVSMIFQPLLAGSGPAAGPEGAVDPGLLESFTELVGQVAADLPPGATDLSGIYRDVDEPVFFDLFHTGERGAAIAAERIYELLRPSLLGQQGPGQQGLGQQDADGG